MRTRSGERTHVMRRVLEINEGNDGESALLFLHGKRD